MKRTLALLVGLSGMSTVAQAATAPIQRVDVVNLLAHDRTTPGVTASPVTVKFYTSGSSTACATATLPYDGGTSIFAGAGLACTTAITNLSVTVAAGPGNVIVYSDLVSTAFTATGKFSEQVEINESTAPAFSATNGGISSMGTITLLQQASAQ